MDLKIFENEEFGEIRIVDQEGDPWFIANDIAKALGYARPKDAIAIHCKYVEILKGGEALPFTSSPMGIGIIPESDVYRLIMRSKRPGIEYLKDNLLKQISDIKSVMKALHDFEIPDDLPEMFVYAIREEDTGNIKLGISKDPNARLKQLQTGNSSKLTLVGVKQAVNRFKDERAIHQRNEAIRIHGEWFSHTAQL
jgi:predicted GIY-YIG superfamily endonuclease